MPEEALRRQRATIDAIRRLNYRGEAPVQRSIATELGLASPGSVDYRLNLLIKKGLARKSDKGHIVLVDPASDVRNFVKTLAATWGGRFDHQFGLNRAMADRLRALRIDNGIDDVEMARALGLQTPNYRRVEWGVAWMTATQLVLAARILGVSADYFSQDKYGSAAIAGALSIEDGEIA